MQLAYITDNDFNKLVKLKIREYEKAERKYKTKIKTHFKDEKLKSFFSNCSQEINPVLYTVPFDCYFSLYMYLYLKSKCEPYNFDKSRYQFHVSQPLDVNVTQIARLADISLNTVRTAYRELVSMGFLLGGDLLKIKVNQPNRVLVVNDFWLVGYDQTTKTVIFKRTLEGHENQSPAAGES